MKKLWSPSAEFTENSNMNIFMDWVNESHGLQLQNYSELWSWSVDRPFDFWESIFRHYDIIHDGSANTVCEPKPGIIGSKWFPDTQVNYAEHVFRNSPQGTAIEFANEQGAQTKLSWDELKIQTAQLAAHFKKMGLGKGSKIAAFLPNVPQAIIAFLACNSIGAIWSSCSPDFGTASVLERFQQIEPDILLLTNGYWYNGKAFDKSQANHELIQQLTSIQQAIVIQYCSDVADFKHKKAIDWQSLPQKPTELTFERIPFNDPIWVLYSSGTTGKPKAITHSMGGILIEHFKALGLHQDVKKGEVFFWFSTTGWMMWNYANAALLLGGTVAIFDGSPTFPNLNVLWDFASKAKVNHFGAGASYFQACMKLRLKLNSPLPYLRSLGSTGSPLTPKTFSWIYEYLKNDLWLISLSGGTDVCSGFVGGNPFDPVFEGAIQCRMLGVNLQAYNEQGEQVTNQLGEMVIETPLPSMPIYFWNDTENKRYKSSYFEMYPGKWRHGDWINIDQHGRLVIHGRSDSTLNGGGIRIGTSEIYNGLAGIQEIKDSIVVCVDHENGKQQLLLFVVIDHSNELTADLTSTITKQLKTKYSPRHVPDEIIATPSIPYTISGKKMEGAVKNIMSGRQPSISKDAMKNPESLTFFEQLVARKK